MVIKRYNIQVTVVKVANGCSLGFKEGDSWLITDKTPAGMCLNAYATIWPNIRTLRYGGLGDRDTSRVSCPDPNHCVVYEVKRLRG